MSIRSVEQKDGTISVYSNGDYLVNEGTSRKVGVVLDSDRGLAAAEIHIVATDAVIDPSGGQLRGLLDSRDKVLGGFLDQLNDFAGTLAYQFNKVYAGGQGLKGFDSLTGTFAASDTTRPLNDAGLKFSPQNGSFQVLVKNTKTGITRTTDVLVNLNGTGHQTTLEDIRQAH